MLVAALSLLSSDQVTLSDIDAAAEYLRQFYQKFHDLYGKLLSVQVIQWTQFLFELCTPHNIMHNDIYMSMYITCIFMSFCVLHLLFYVGEHNAPMNVHLLIHICDCVKMWGPLWCYSCFTFETMNGHLKKLFHGTRDMTKQVILAQKLYYVCVL